MVDAWTLISLPFSSVGAVSSATPIAAVARQVTLLSEERWAELMQEVGASVGPAARRANLVISGINLENTRGRVLHVGRCRLRIGGETRPCEQMENIAAGLQQAMRERWGGGAFAEVLVGGPIAVGDVVSWDED
jgi:MOSC domain-containing protein YiiM